MSQQQTVVSDPLRARVEALLTAYEDDAKHDIEDKREVYDLVRDLVAEVTRLQGIELLYETCVEHYRDMVTQADLNDAALRDAQAQQAAAQAVVDEQAEDAGLWCITASAPEVYLQRALRRVHAAVEGDRAPDAAPGSTETP